VGWRSLQGHIADPLGSAAGSRSIWCTGRRAIQPSPVESPWTGSPAARRQTLDHTHQPQARPLHSARPANGDLSDIALDATIRQAALEQTHRESERAPLSSCPRMCRKRSGYGGVEPDPLVVDASWSMAGAQRMEATKGAIMSLLVDAYQKREPGGAGGFQKEEARLSCPSLRAWIWPGSATPPAGRRQDAAVRRLMLAYSCLSPRAAAAPKAMPLMILLTDGAGNVALTETRPRRRRKRSPT